MTTLAELLTRPEVIPGMLACGLFVGYLATRAKVLNDYGMHKTSILLHGDDNQGTMLLVKTDITATLSLDWANKYILGSRRWGKDDQRVGHAGFDEAFVVKSVSTSMQQQLRSDTTLCQMFADMAAAIPKAHSCSLNGGDRCFRILFTSQISQKQALQYKAYLDQCMPTLCARLRGPVI